MPLNFPRHYTKTAIVYKPKDRVQMAPLSHSHPFRCHGCRDEWLLSSPVVCEPLPSAPAGWGLCAPARRGRCLTPPWPSHCQECQPPLTSSCLRLPRCSWQAPPPGTKAARRQLRAPFSEHHLRWPTPVAPAHAGHIPADRVTNASSDLSKRWIWYKNGLLMIHR